MFCPVCVEPDLVMTERQGIEIDYCPKCRGVWLDRGELDKLIERGTAPPPGRAGAGERDRHAGAAEQPRYRADDYREPERREGEYRRDEYRGDEHHGGPRRKKKGFLGELFDFD